MVTGDLQDLRNIQQGLRILVEFTSPTASPYLKTNRLTVLEIDLEAIPLKVIQQLDALGWKTDSSSGGVYYALRYNNAST